MMVRSRGKRVAAIVLGLLVFITPRGIVSVGLLALMLIGWEIFICE